MLFGGKRTKPDPVTVEWTIEWFSDDPETEDEVRRIVREEMAELVPIDVPDAPPKDL